MALREIFCIEHKHFGLDTLRVPNRSHTSSSKSKDFPERSGDISGALGTHFQPMLGIPKAKAQQDRKPGSQGESSRCHMFWTIGEVLGFAEVLERTYQKDIFDRPLKIYTLLVHEK